jgi:hypothetical protein
MESMTRVSCLQANDNPERIIMCPVKYNNPTPASKPVPKAAAPVPAPKPTTAAQAVAKLDAALDLLKTSSNSTLANTIVYDAVQAFEKAIAELKSVIK